MLLVKFPQTNPKSKTVLGFVGALLSRELELTTVTVPLKKMEVYCKTRWRREREASLHHMSYNLFSTQRTDLSLSVCN